jgi:type I restriction enzyme, S subunit
MSIPSSSAISASPRELLEKHFDLALDAPDGIKKLRELILTLAMQGKLVPQDPKDQPASELLKEIEAEKRRLVKEGKIKERGGGRGRGSRGDAEGAEIRPEDQPYMVPAGWEWVRLGDVLQFINGDRGKNYPSKDKLSNTGIPFISAINIEKGTVSIENLLYVNQAQYDKLGGGKLEKNDIVFCIRGSLGKSAIYPFESGAIASSLVILRQYYKDIDQLHYLYKYLLCSLLFSEIAEKNNGTAQPNLSANSFMSFLFPLPPLAEQKRIVAKIDQLMALCDALEELRNKRQQMRLDIHAAAIHYLLDSYSAPSQGSAPRLRVENASSLAPPTATPRLRVRDFLFSHFSNIYSVKENVAELRKAILQLAMMGKLVPQDPRDQPASELLKEIEAEKKRLVKEGKIKNGSRGDAEGAEIKAEDVPYTLPAGWKWVRLEELCTLITDGTHLTPRYLDNGIPFISVKNLSSGKIDFTDTKYISEIEHQELSRRCRPESGDVLLTKIGTTGIAVVVNIKREFSIFVSVALLKLVSSKVFPRFIESLINSPLVKKYSADGTEGVGNKNLVLRKIREYVIPLPPLAEQKRIVAKIDQLMALCDSLEQGIDAATVKQTQVLESIIAGVA